MFYYNLDGNPLDNKTGTQTAVGGEELTGIEDIYWSGTEFNSLRAWFFRFDPGRPRAAPSSPTQFRRGLCVRAMCRNRPACC